MNVRIHAVKNENIEYKVQKVRESFGDVNKDIMNENNQLREEKEELKSRVFELENKIKRNSTADPTIDTQRETYSNREMIRSRSPVPVFPKEYDNLMSRKFSKEDQRYREDVLMINNGSGSIAATTYYQGYASPATKSAMSDRSWIDNKEVNQTASLESAQMIIEKLSKVINHLQNELSKNTMLISQLMEENRQYQERNNSSYNKE